jgi:acetylornithine deacetylase/succinyl-diaminopimelate desuccinylase-like protein
MEQFKAYVDANRERFLKELTALVAQPSIVAQGIGLEETAEMVWIRLEHLGASLQRFDLPGSPPILVAEIGQGKRTMLVYNHYDVQPPEPLDEWESPPFEPVIRDGRIYGRGVADDKGDLQCRLHAIDAYQRAVGPLPLRLRFLIEGEEEVGSPHLGPFAGKHRELLQADGCLWETGQKDAARRPVLELGVKGICYIELSTTTAATDLHSMWGGVVPNAAWRLVWALGTLKDKDGRILVEGLMDNVRRPSRAETSLLERLPFDAAAIRESFGFGEYVRGLSGTELLAELFYHPTCTICGIESGYTGPGAKTVLPNKATAKIDFRLVPDLTPGLVLGLLRDHLDRNGFHDVEIELVNGLHPARSRLDAPFVEACVAAAEAAYGTAPIIYPTSPGSGPLAVVARDVPAVMAGVGHPSAHLHAPNENIFVEDYFEGIRFVEELIHRFAG